MKAHCGQPDLGARGAGSSHAVGSYILCLVLIVFAVFLAACQDEPTPTVVPVTPTGTHSPTITKTLTSTPTRTPTRPMPTVTETPSPSLTSTSAPPSSTPTATTTPIIPVAERLATAETLRRFGDYEHAVAEYAAVISANPEPGLVQEVLIQLGDTYQQLGDNRMVVDLYEHLLRAFPETPRMPEILCRLAAAYRERGDWAQTILFYERYIATQEDVPGAIYVHIAEAAAHLGQDDSTAVAYQRALSKDIPFSLRKRIVEELAVIYRRLGKVDQAIAQYERAYELATYDAHRAGLLFAMGETLREAERLDPAARRYEQVVDAYPEDQSAYLALVALLDMGITEVDPLQRAIIDYHAGQYGIALELLVEYVQEYVSQEALSQDDLATAYLYMGLIHRQLGDWADALEAFGFVADELPESKWAGASLYQTARVLEFSGEDEQALEAYDRLVADYPEHVLADDALWLKAQLLETLAERESAAETYEQLIAEYPESVYAASAGFQIGLAYFVLDAHEDAAEAWDRSAKSAGEPDAQARLLFWSGRAFQAAGEVEAAIARWEEAVDLAPDGYYGLRAEALLAGVQPEIAPSERNEALFDLSTYDIPHETADVEDWLQSWTGGEPETLVAAHKAIRGMKTYQNGQQSLACGSREDAVDEFEYLRQQLADDPLQLYALALDLDEMGLYRVVLSCVDRIITLSETSTIREVPSGLLLLGYPTHYADLVVPGASNYNVDPRLFFALMRQESRFDSRATSWAGARGLAQVMPATGEWIAFRLGQDEFKREELYRPYLSVDYGLWYLAFTLDMFDGNIFGALAGYNGGPGNVEGWAGGLPIRDVDRFVENIGAAETNTYVKIVWEQYEVYRYLYPVPEDRS